MASHFSIWDTMLWHLPSTVLSSVAVMVLKPTFALIHVALYAEGTSRTCQEEEWMETELWRASPGLIFHSELPRRSKTKVRDCAFIPGRSQWWWQCTWKSSRDYSANVHLLSLLHPHCCSLSLLFILSSPQLSFFFFFPFFPSETIQFLFPGDVWGHHFNSDELQKWENQTSILTALPLLPLGPDHQDHSWSRQGLITEVYEKGDSSYWNYYLYHKIFWLLLATGPDPVSKPHADLPLALWVFHRQAAGDYQPLSEVPNRFV